MPAEAGSGMPSDALEGEARPGHARRPCIVRQVRFGEIADNFLPDELLTTWDRQKFFPDELRGYHDWIQSWITTGVAILPKLIPDELLDAYCMRRAHLIPMSAGWSSPTPYTHVKELRDLALYAPLMRHLEILLEERAGLHLNLTGWVSTERAWHQDTYLNPPHVGAHYAAVWTALEDISPLSGPFMYYPGSHRWAVIRRHHVFKHMTEAEQLDENWPKKTEDWIAAACVEEARRYGTEPVEYLPKRGDVLIWHSNLIHCGSKPIVPGTERKSLISHYSAISKRPDMPAPVQHDNGEYFFPFDRPLY